MKTPVLYSVALAMSLFFSCGESEEKFSSDEYKNAEVITFEADLAAIESAQSDLAAFEESHQVASLDSISGVDFSGDAAFWSEMRVKQPKCKRVIKRSGSAKIELQGLDFFVKNQKVVGVGSLTITPQTLAAITETFAMLDDYLFSNCNDLNREFSLPSPSHERITMLYEQKERLMNKFLEAADVVKANATGTDGEKNIVEGLKVINSEGDQKE